MRIYNDKKGIALILLYLLITLLVILLISLLSISIRSMREAERQQNWLRALYAAESGVDIGLDTLPIHYDWQMPPFPIRRTLGNPPNSECKTEIRFFSSDPLQTRHTKWYVNGTGSVPNATALPRFEIEIEVVVEEEEQDTNFFSNAIYSAGNLTIRGNSYNIDGDVFYDEDNTLNIAHPENITGDIIPGDPADFSNDINYNILRNRAESQELSDTYDHLITVSQWSSSNLPGNFWFDEANGIPNVIYVEGTGSEELRLSGNRTVGGLVVIVSADCNVTGTFTVNGCLLVTDDLKVSGTLNIIGGVWAGDIVAADEGGTKDGALITGDAQITYDANYMDSVKTLDMLDIYDMRILSWQELRREVRQ